MSDFIWGLTTRDIENALWNSLSGSVMLFGGMFVAAAANNIARSLFSSNTSNRVSYDGPNQGSSNKKLCTLAGIATGVAASYYLADRLPLVTFVAEKALKFAVISFITGVIGVQVSLAGIAVVFLTLGGAMGNFGHCVLFYEGIAGAVIGSATVSFLSP